MIHTSGNGCSCGRIDNVQEVDAGVVQVKGERETRIIWNKRCRPLVQQKARIVRERERETGKDRERQRDRQTDIQRK